ncbi:YggS family pyridoxal phosphate-dependent enzyme [Calderihabitans maritimus]|uniref:Pyridoxal phosphate homeostasis protein n=1 Tax=Calderihabitans maritimus TaxID=1246530 RepID=A0A1Z5HSS7_9FIRM|nr:YggS family pyridoxal phosphate-dependent enzyme [Calderihabitans maritimus]GAW92586.1 alanine racemase domain-containing protein [Calderihabitans maritimus]
MNQISRNLQEVLENIRQSALKANRNPEDITLVAVTKTVGIAEIETAIQCGVTDIGENRAQEAVRKYEVIGDRVRWHFIGRLQTNKVKYIIDKVHLIHSLDRRSLAEELNKRAEALGRPVQVLVQVNVSGEETKSGLPVQQVIPFLRQMNDFPYVKVKGLMTMAPYVVDAEEVRWVFRRLRELFEEIKGSNIPGISMDYLSMGMTNDYRVAVEEGANMVRIGSAIFGSRN